MESADKLFEKAKRLKPEELSELVARLDEYLLLSSASDESSKGARSYVRSLALSGTADADWTDVSSHKGRHLADAYGSRHER
jgi:hypothetical protein